MCCVLWACRLCVVVYHQSPTSLIDEPQGRRGSPGVLTMLTGATGARASGRAEARPHARGSRLDVHTELFGYVGASRRTYRIVCLRGSPFGAKKIKSIRPPCCSAHMYRMIGSSLSTHVRIYVLFLFYFILFLFYLFFIYVFS